MPRRHRPTAPTAQEDDRAEDAELTAYNEYLARWPNGTRPPGADRRGRSGGRARTSNIRLQRPTFCRLNYPGTGRSAR